MLQNANSPLTGYYEGDTFFVYSLQRADAMPRVIFRYEVSVREISDASQATSPCRPLQTYVF